MKIKNKLYLALFMLLSFCLFSCKKESVTPANTCETSFYYYFKDKIYLEKSATKLTVGFNESVSYEEAEKLIEEFNYFEKLEPKNFVSADKKYSKVNIKGYRTCDEIKEILRFVKKDDRITFANQDFIPVKSKTKELVGLTDDFIVGLKDSNDISILQEFALKNKVKIVPGAAYSSFFILRVDKTSDKNALEMANYFQESGLFYFAQPDFLISVKPH